MRRHLPQGLHQRITHRLGGMPPAGQVQQKGLV
jgi:hypothetical protein